MKAGDLIIRTDTNELGLVVNFLIIPSPSSDLLEILWEQGEMGYIHESVLDVIGTLSDYDDLVQTFYFEYDNSTTIRDRNGDQNG